MEKTENFWVLQSDVSNFYIKEEWDEERLTLDPMYATRFTTLERAEEYNQHKDSLSESRRVFARYIPKKVIVKTSVTVEE